MNCTDVYSVKLTGTSFVLDMVEKQINTIPKVGHVQTHRALDSKNALKTTLLC